MLVVKVEIWPGGDSDRAKEIGRMGLANVSDLRQTSNYVFVALDDRGNEIEGEVRGHKRSAGFWKLLQEAAREADLGDGEAPEAEVVTVKAIKERMGARTNPQPVS